MVTRAGSDRPEDRSARGGALLAAGEGGTEAIPNGDQPSSNQVIEMIDLPKTPFGGGKHTGHERHPTGVREELWLSGGCLSSNPELHWHTTLMLAAHSDFGSF